MKLERERNVKDGSESRRVQLSRSFVEVEESEQGAERCFEERPLQHCRNSLGSSDRKAESGGDCDV